MIQPHKHTHKMISCVLLYASVLLPPLKMVMDELIGTAKVPLEDIATTYGGGGRELRLEGKHAKKSKIYVSFTVKDKAVLTAAQQSELQIRQMMAELERQKKIDDKALFANRLAALGLDLKGNLDFGPDSEQNWVGTEFNYSGLAEEKRRELAQEKVRM